jgi:hypothetical protein
MIDLQKYKHFFDSRTQNTILFEAIQRVIVNPKIPDQEVSGINKIVAWGPNEVGGPTSYISVYYDGETDTFRQDSFGAWNEIMKDAIDSLRMVPDSEDETRLVNINKEITQAINFDVSEHDWRIVDWFTRATVSIDEPFTLTNDFPNPEAGNLLCDLVVWKNNQGQLVEMVYGWNAYKN